MGRCQAGIAALGGRDAAVEAAVAFLSRVALLLLGGGGA